MHKPLRRRSRLAVLGAGLSATAAAIAIVTSAAGPALADTTDTGGSAAVSIPTHVIAAMAKSGVAMLADTPASASADPVARTDTVTMTVTGGNGEVSNFTGIVNLGGSLQFVDGATGKHVVIDQLEFSFFSGALTGKPVGGPRRIFIALIGGNQSTSTGTGTETFSCDTLNLTRTAARYLNGALHSSGFVAGTNIGSFTTTFDVTIT